MAFRMLWVISKSWMQKQKSQSKAGYLHKLLNHTQTRRFIGDVTRERVRPRRIKRIDVVKNTIA